MVDLTRSHRRSARPRPAASVRQIRRAVRPSCAAWLHPPRVRSPAGARSSPSSSSPESRSAGRTWSSSAATTSAAGRGRRAVRIEQITVECRPARPPTGQPDQLGGYVGRRMPVRSLAGGGLHQGPGQARQQHRVRGVQADVGDPELDGRVLVGQAGVEVDHPPVEQHPGVDECPGPLRGRPRPNRTAPSGRRWGTGSTPGTGSSRSRCRGPASTGSSPRGPTGPAARSGSGRGPQPPRRRQRPRRGRGSRR